MTADAGLTPLVVRVKLAALLDSGLQLPEREWKLIQAWVECAGIEEVELVIRPAVLAEFDEEF